MSMYDELTWSLSFAGITDGGAIGAPANTLATAFSLGIRFQYRQMHAGAAYRFQTARWSNLFDEEISTHILGGRAWYGPGQTEPVGDPVTGVPAGIIATQATTGYNGTTGLFANPIIVRRTLCHFPQGVHVVLAPTFTGGTDPHMLVGLEVTGKR